MGVFACAAAHVAALVERRRARVAALPRFVAVRTEAAAWIPESDEWQAAIAEGAEEFADAIVPDRFCERAARSRRRDPAAVWLAENHPTALSEFGHDY